MPQNRDSHSAPGISDSDLKKLALALLLVGLAWRVVRYLLRFPIWGDECLIGMNFVWFGYGELVRHLENCQIAPLLFLWGERFAYTWLGPGELSMRLLPFAAGTASLFLYWRLTGLVLEPMARLFAVGFLAVAIWPVSMCTLMKPYALDLFSALILLLPAAQWLKTPSRSGSLAWLVFLAPVALLASYPTVFIAGAVSLTLLLPVWKQGWKARLLFAAYNVTLLAGFLLSYYVGRNQLNTTTGAASTQVGMADYWADGFPPHSILAFPFWFIRLTAGQMTAYPVGSSNGGSIITVLFCVAGIVVLAKQKRWRWISLLTAPIALGLVASILHRYPYGTSGRLNQHLAPGICILAGLGLALLIGRTAHAKRWTLIATTIFALIGLGGLIKDVFRPYRDIGCEWTRSTALKIQKQLPAKEPVIICATPQTMPNGVFTWYWLADQSRPVSWNFEPPAASLNVRRLCGFHQGILDADDASHRLAAELVKQDPAWHLVKRETYHFLPHSRKLIPDQCDLYHFER